MTSSSVPRAVVIYSGGMDSYTVLHRARREGYELHALSFNYGQRHARELDTAKQVCEELGIAHQIVDIRAIHGLIDSSALTDASQALPGGDYDADNLNATVVPNRNMILLSLAIAQAVNIGADRVFYGAHGGDHVLYPDCRPEFVEKMNDVAAIANFSAVTIEAPYLHKSKDEILADGLAMGLDYAQTWTCYLGAALACGDCGSCRERLAAFAHHGLSDPLGYLQRPEAAASQRPEAAASQRPEAAASQRPEAAASQRPGTDEKTATSQRPGTDAEVSADSSEGRPDV